MGGKALGEGLAELGEHVETLEITLSRTTNVIWRKEEIGRGVEATLHKKTFNGWEKEAVHIQGSHSLLQIRSAQTHLTAFGESSGSGCAGVKPGMLSKYSTAELHPQPLFSVIMLLWFCLFKKGFHYVV